jgi:hypothetical protein
MKTRKRKKAEKGWAIELTPVAVQTTSTAQLGEVAGLNAGGQLRRARRGDDDDEALVTKNTGASDSSEEASAFSETPVAGAICGAIPAVGGNPAPMCLEAKQHLEQLADAQRAVDAWHRDANPAWHVFKAVSTSDGVAVQCLACPTQKGNGQTKFFKFGPLGNAKPTGSFDFGHFVARHLRTPSHQRNWDAWAVRVSLELRPPGPPTAPQAQRVLPLPETHLQVMSRTHNADFNITATLWSCRRCGKQGVFNSSTTSGTLSSHRGSMDCSTKRPQRALATRLRQFLVASEAVQAARQAELRFPAGSAVRVKLLGGRFCRATVVRTRGGMVVAALESNNFATVSAVASAVDLEPPSACHGMWVPILQLPNNGGRVDLRAVGAIIPEVTDGDLRIAFTTANNEDCDQRGLHYITVVYSVHRSVDSPAARRDAHKLVNLKAALEAARLAKRVRNRLESQHADAEELDL